MSSALRTQRRVSVTATAVALLLALGACSSGDDATPEDPTSSSADADATGDDAATPDVDVDSATEDAAAPDADAPTGDDGAGAGSPTGIPATYPAGVADGLARYPDVGDIGMGDVGWTCPLTGSVTVDGQARTGTMTTISKIVDGVHQVDCGFDPAMLRYAEAADAAAYAELVAATNVVEQPGSVQTQSEVTVGERTFVAVTREYPEIPEIGIEYVACYLDEATLSRACLEVGNSPDRSADYDANRAADDLAAILTGG